MGFFASHIVTFFGEQVLYAKVPPSGTHPYAELNATYLAEADGQDEGRRLRGQLALALQLLHRGTREDQRAGVSILRNIRREQSPSKLDIIGWVLTGKAHAWSLASAFLCICYHEGAGVSRR